MLFYQKSSHFNLLKKSRFDPILTPTVVLKMQIFDKNRPLLPQKSSEIANLTEIDESS
jgi:hypothetical protein